MPWLCRVFEPRDKVGTAHTAPLRATQRSQLQTAYAVRGLVLHDPAHCAVRRARENCLHIGAEASLSRDSTAYMRSLAAPFW